MSQERGGPGSDPEASAGDSPDPSPEVLGTIAPQPWAERIARTVELAEGALVVLVDQARDKMIGHLARALVRAGFEPDFCVDWSETATAKDGSVVVLLLRPWEFALANMGRGRIEEKRLRVVLWVTDGGRLRREANDLADWISHTIECPDGPIPFAVRRLARTPGQTIQWLGDRRELFLALRALDIHPTVASRARTFEDLLHDLRDASNWVVVDSDDPFLSGKVRLALSHLGRRGHVVVVGAFWTHALELDSDTRDLRATPRSQRTAAALLDLNPVVELEEFRGIESSSFDARLRSWTRDGRRKAVEVANLEPASARLPDLHVASHLSERSAVQLLNDGYLDVVGALSRVHDAQLAWWLRSDREGLRNMADLELRSWVEAWVSAPDRHDALSLLECGHVEEALLSLETLRGGNYPTADRVYVLVERGHLRTAFDAASALVQWRHTTRVDELLLWECVARSAAALKFAGATEAVQRARTLRTAIGLGAYHQARGFWVEAEVALMRAEWSDALAASTRAIRLLNDLRWGPHPMRARVLLTLGRAHASLANYAEAVANLARAAKEIVRATKRDDHPLACSALHDRARARRAMGQASDEEVDRARDAVDAVYPYGHPELERAGIPRGPWVTETR